MLWIYTSGEMRWSQDLFKFFFIFFIAQLLVIQRLRAPGPRNLLILNELQQNAKNLTFFLR